MEAGMLLLDELVLLRGGVTTTVLLPLLMGTVMFELGTMLHSETRGLVKSLWYLSTRFPMLS